MFLLTSDGTESTPAVIASLQKKGWKKIAVLLLPSQIVPDRIPLPSTVTEVALHDIDGKSIKRNLEHVRSQAGPIGSFLHLHPHYSTRRQTDSGNGPEAKLVKFVFFLAQVLAKELTAPCPWGRRCFVAATRLDGLLGLAGDVPYRSLGGGLSGLIKTLNIEWRSVFCRAVDLHPEQKPQEAAEFLAAEIYDADLLVTETGYRRGERYTLAAAPSEEPLPDTPSSSGISADSVFMVSGGAKGVTASCVLELARLYRCGFVLIGRSEVMEEEPLWARNCCDETEMKRRILEFLCSEGIKPTPVKIKNLQKKIDDSREIRQTLQKIKAHGGRAAYIQANITDSKGLQESLSRVVENLGEITGVIHGAGVLADKRIENKTESDYDSVFRTKVVGLFEILKTVSMDRIEHFVLFSSAAGFYGNEAQADYALANEILNKQAHRIKADYPNCRVVAFNWGPWDSGMVTPQLKQLFRSRNIRIIPTDVGSRIFADELSNFDKSRVQLVVGSSMALPASTVSKSFRSRIRTHLNLSENGTVRDHVVGGKPVLPFTFALSWMAKICERLFPGYRLNQCRDSRVLKGIVFQESTSTQYTVSIRFADSADSNLMLDVEIASDSNGKHPIFHYKSVICLTNRQERSEALYQLKDNGRHPVSGAELYRDGTLFHGPALRTIRKVDRLDASNITTTCMIDPISGKEQGSFPVSSFNHFADDALLQAVVVWARHRYGMASLPLKIKKGTFFRPTPFRKPFRVSADITSHNSSKVVSDVVACDDNGRITTRLHGVEITLSRNLNRKFLNE